MKFQDFPYERPDIDALNREVDALTEAFVHADSAREQIRLTYRYFDVQNHFSTMTVLSAARSRGNTEDEYYRAEYAYCCEVSPVFTEHCNRFLQAFLDSAFRPQLEEEFGRHLFDLFRAGLSSFDESIIPDLQEESVLIQKYNHLFDDATVLYRGTTIPMYELNPLFNDPDRSVRKDAAEAYYSFYQEHLDDFDGVYDDLVKVRTRMAKKLHADSYTEIAYPRLCKDYTPEEAARFREGIYRSIVPLTVKARDIQRQILHLPDFKYYDQGLNFRSGNARPVQGLEKQLECARQMYDELSPETSEYFRMMLDRELFDLADRPHKYQSPYCTWVGDYNVPFLYAVNSGTLSDVNLLTHEAGHGFQAYMTSKTNRIPDYMFPAYDACEIMSTAMEFITFPWLPLFFGDQAKKYEYYEVAEGLYFLPYVCCVDEFQHEVYAHPEMTPRERRTMWRNLEKKYMPYIDYDGNTFLEEGGYWFLQSHIFSSPFYYLDYALAEIAAYEYWMKTQQDREKGWADYLAICKAGGRYGLHKLLEIGGLSDPFDPRTMERVGAYVSKWLQDFDFSRLDPVD